MDIIKPGGDYMGLFSKKEKHTKIIFQMEDGLQSIQKGMPVEIILLEDELNIKQNFSRKEPSHLRYEQVINAGVVREEEITEKNKSVVGRAVVGNLVLGPLGAVVGGVSGVGKKEKKKLKAYFVINYKSSQDDEVKVLSFLVTGNTIGLPKFEKELKEKAGIKEEIIDETNL